MTETIVGVDFSGAAQPGESIWLTETTVDDGRLRVDRCTSAGDALDATDRSTVLSGLVDRLLKDPPDAVGFDFPFCLPRAVLDDLAPSVESYDDVCDLFSGFDSATAMRDACTDSANAVTNGDRTYLRRATDDPLGAKSPYHFFTFRQCYHGVTEILGPLIDHGVTVRPMLDGNGPTVVEVYPAATLSRLGLPRENYKNDHEDARQTRKRIVEHLERRHADDADGVVRPLDGRTRTDLLNDTDGDALDSLVAAVATARALRRDFAVDDDRCDPLEGYIYI